MIVLVTFEDGTQARIEAGSLEAAERRVRELRLGIGLGFTVAAEDGDGGETSAGDG